MEQGEHRAEGRESARRNAAGDPIGVTVDFRTARVPALSHQRRRPSYGLWPPAGAGLTLAKCAVAGASAGLPFGTLPVIPANSMHEMLVVPDPVVPRRPRPGWLLAHRAADGDGELHPAGAERIRHSAGGVPRALQGHDVTAPASSLAGTVGSWVGASVMYWASYLIGRPLLMKYGRYVHDHAGKNRAGRGVVVALRHGRCVHLAPAPGHPSPDRHSRRASCACISAGTRWQRSSDRALWCAVLCWVGVTAGQDEQLMQGNLHRITLWVGGLLARSWARCTISSCTGRCAGDARQRHDRSRHRPPAGTNTVSLSSGQSVAGAEASTRRRAYASSTTAPIAALALAADAQQQPAGGDQPHRHVVRRPHLDDRDGRHGRDLLAGAASS
ncbi:MAG: hypothetical protein MZV49_13150 [Rhodopseudomonas palustris]|nr:hypothetical protein [Rhodopseudomonas palustris]